MKVIPAIDLRDGRCVRLLQGDFDRETEYSGDPRAVARRFARLGVERLHVVDLDGARDGRQGNAPVVRRIAAESTLKVQLGGGIRDRETLETWLSGGVDRCVIGSLAVTDAGEVRRWLTEFGTERIVLALDVRLDSDGRPMLSTHGWRETSQLSLWDCIEGFLPDGLRHVLCTDVSRDGAMSGPNVGLYEQIVDRYPDLELQASGGVRGVDDLRRLRAAGVAAAITGRALLDGNLSEAEVRSFRQDA